MSDEPETVMPEPGTVLKTLADIPDPGGLPADFEPTPIVVLRSGETVTAYLNVCPHAGRPFSLPSGKTLVSEGKFFRIVLCLNFINTYRTIPLCRFIKFFKRVIYR